MNHPNQSTTTLMRLDTSDLNLNFNASAPFITNNTSTFNYSDNIGFHGINVAHNVSNNNNNNTFQNEVNVVDDDLVINNDVVQCAINLQSEMLQPLQQYLVIIVIMVMNQII